MKFNLSFAVFIFAGALLVSCAGSKKEACVKCEIPTFSIMFWPKNAFDSETDLHLEEYPDRIVISSVINNPNEPIIKGAEYSALKAFLLSSEQWSVNASEDYYNGPWMGGPRDILVIEKGDLGLHLQGDEIPVTWRRKLLAFASEHRK